MEKALGPDPERVSSLLPTPKPARSSPAASEQRSRRPRLGDSGWANGSVYSGDRHSSYDTCLLSPREDLSGSMPILYSSSVSCWELRDLTPPPPVDDPLCKPLNKAHAASLALAARNSSRDNAKPLPKKAKWLIIVIGIILFGMSMLLVGITLRLAPMIDEMVRQQHEDFARQQLQRNANHSHAVTNSTGAEFMSTINSTLVEQ